ncbi:enoyl-CoA hydratase/isomerase family protein [Marivibrio halodurans]|uniref:3-hydroxyisobutyryl-CoA hydrolase n=1 Tax=Marivibrio halodurans TaxID=2039722 RepID=A0A8J7V2G9_9PROT|nr:enoyl-CoA hydratase/isomerase family protein [Marivibrio halodurans]MBP5855754.1 enoyl-CoA hydratase/isomerase family protein [Marivibrio halodurans]
MSDEDEILFDRAGDLGVVTLNRPKALNALNLSMIEKMNPVLADWREDDSVAAVLIKGEGGKAFCAGGDVRAVWEAGRTGGDLTSRFFWEEYSLNRKIHMFPKPYIALLDGVTMGGGVGLSIHGSHRVATERLMFAMPETGIGLFPDVGGSWFLNKCPGETGLYLALTGARIGAADAAALGLATHVVGSDDLPALEAALAGASLKGDAAAAIGAVLADFNRHAGEPVLAPNRAIIDRCFAHDRLEDIFDALAADGSAFAAETLAVLEKKSPTSMKVTLAQLRRGRELGFDACMTMEYRLSQACMRPGSDFYEGIRAVLVDKDHAPNWSASGPEEVDDETVQGYFAPVAPDLRFA